MSLSALATRLAARLRVEPLAPKPALPTLMRPSRRAVGTVDTHNPRNRRLVVTVDEEIFEHVGRAAAAAGISQSEAIRQLLRRGIDASTPRGD